MLVHILNVPELPSSFSAILHLLQHPSTWYDVAWTLFLHSPLFSVWVAFSLSTHPVLCRSMLHWDLQPHVHCYGCILLNPSYWFGRVPLTWESPSTLSPYYKQGCWLSTLYSQCLAQSRHLINVWWLKLDWSWTNWECIWPLFPRLRNAMWGRRLTARVLKWYKNDIVAIQVLGVVHRTCEVSLKDERQGFYGSPNHSTFSFCTFSFPHGSPPTLSPGNLKHIHDSSA